MQRPLLPVCLRLVCLRLVDAKARLAPQVIALQIPDPRALDQHVEHAAPHQRAGSLCALQPVVESQGVANLVAGSPGAVHPLLGSQDAARQNLHQPIFVVPATMEQA